LPVQLIQSENVRGPLIVAGDCNGVWSWKLCDELVMFAMQPGHMPKGAKNESVPGVPGVAGVDGVAR
jgi:hypothetical protein